MKYFILLIGACSLIGCNTRVDDRIFDQGMNQRIASATKAYKARLTQKEHGWKAQYTLPPKDKKRFIGTIQLLLNFKGDSVNIKSDYRGGRFDGVIGYKIVQGWKVELIFESYSPIHALHELKAFLSGGGFIFNFNSSSAPDSIILDRRLNRFEPQRALKERQKLAPNRLILTPATPSDWKKIEAAKGMDEELEKATTLRLPGKNYGIRYDGVHKIFTVTIIPQKTLPGKTIWTPIVIPAVEKKSFVKVDSSGFTLTTPITLLSTQMVGFTYDNKTTFTFICNEDPAISIQ